MNNIFIHKNSCNIYMLLWSCYYLQGTFYEFGSIIAKICLAIALIMSMYYWIYANIYYVLPKPLKILNAFVIMLLVYSFIYYGFSDIYQRFDGLPYTAVDNIKGCLSSLLPIYSCYIFVEKNYLNAYNIKYWFIVILVVITGQFFVYEEVRMIANDYDSEGLTNNIAYQFVSIVPFLFFFRKNEVIMYLFILYILIFIIYGMKRGAIIIGVIAIIYVIYNSYKQMELRNKIYVICMFICVIYLISKVVFILATENDYFNYRIDKTLEGDSSGRDSYYMFYINSFLDNQSVLRLLFGGGTYYTVKLNGNLAHNDWLELLISYGLLGVSLFFIFWRSLYKYINNLKETDYYNISFCFFIIFLIQTLFSMSYTDMGVFAMMPLAYCMASYDMNEQELE